jgi:ferredoxin--NADP+ reductase
MHLRKLDRGRSASAVVVRNARVTADSDPVEVRRLVLNVAQPGEPHYEGQALGVAVDRDGRETFRLYTLAEVTEVPGDGGIDLALFVRRGGGPVSAYLCDSVAGEAVTLYGPYDYRFRLPMDRRSNLVMIGAGSGVAPFRALVHRAYASRVDWKGKVRIYHGPATGLEILYNNAPGDVGQYFDRRTFKAIDALKTRRSIPGSHEPGRGLAENLAELWDLVLDPDTYVYLVGTPAHVAALDAAMARAAGGEDAWTRAKAALAGRNHWAELLYD